MSTSPDLSELHPVAVFAALAAGPANALPARVDAEPEVVPDRVSVRRRLLAALGRRLGPAAARDGASAPTS